jgi:hypothetical protein
MVAIRNGSSKRPRNVVLICFGNPSRTGVRVAALRSAELVSARPPLYRWTAITTSWTLVGRVRLEA